MDRKYSKAEMKRILRQEISTPALAEQKIQEAYSFVRADATMKRQTESTYQSRVYAVQTDRCGENRRRNTGKPGGRRTGRWAVLAAAMGILVVSSVTVMAVSGMFSKTMEQSGDALSYKMEFNYELTPSTVDVEAGYIPEGYEPQNNGKLAWSADGSGQNGISIAVITADCLDIQPDMLNVDNVKSIEETTINGMDAHQITLDYDTERVVRTFDKRIYLFDETDGCVCVVYGGNDLSMEELTKVAEGLTFTKGEETSGYMSAEDKEAMQKLEEESLAQYEAQQQARLELGVPQKYIYDIGDSLEVTNSFADPGMGIAESNTTKLTVESAEIINSIADYPQENFFNYEDIAPHINEDGTAPSYTRITYRSGEDGTEAQEIARDEGVNRKFLKVTFLAENISDAAIDFWAGAPHIAYLQPNEEGNYRYADTWTEELNPQEDRIAADNMTIYFDKSPYAGELNSHFFYRELGAGETLEYTLLFVVDEDRLDNLYLGFGLEGNVIPEEGETYAERYVRMNVNK